MTYENTKICIKFKDWNFKVQTELESFTILTLKILNIDIIKSNLLQNAKK